MNMHLLMFRQIFLGVAARMASILKLSQESSYNLTPDAPVEAVIGAEVSRRTWWVIFSKSF